MRVRESLRIGIEKVASADYVLLPGKIPGGASPKLMVLLSDERGKVEIAGFPPESVSEKAGMKVGDILLTIDHTPIHTIDDVKIELLSKEKEKKVRVRILRGPMIGGPEEIDFEVTLQ